MNMTGVEIDFITRDSLAALELYESIFEVERIEVTSMPTGSNEAVFSIYGVRFHMLDANEEYGMVAPEPGKPMPMWFNVLVPDIAATHTKAMEAGCTEIQPVTEIEAFGVSNSMFADGFGYTWMLHQIHRIVSFEEREAMYKSGQVE